MRRRDALALFTLAASGNRVAFSRTLQEVPDAAYSEHSAWVGRALKRMLTIVPGMTRADLAKVFRTEGGLSTGLQRTYVSRECPFFKVDVEFYAVGRPDKDADGRVTIEEDGRDVVRSISRPYLQYSIAD